MYPVFCPWMIFRWNQPDYRTAFTFTHVHFEPIAGLIIELCFLVPQLLVFPDYWEIWFQRPLTKGRVWGKSCWKRWDDDGGAWGGASWSLHCTWDQPSPLPPTWFHNKITFLFRILIQEVGNRQRGPRSDLILRNAFVPIKVTNLTGVTTVADGRHSKPASTWPPGKPFWTLQPVPLGFLLAIKGLLIAPTLQAKYLKDWLAFSGIGFVQMPACPKVSFLDYTFRAEFLS